jgi:hypothetical protein
MIFAKRTLVLVSCNSLQYNELRNMNLFDKLEEFLKKDFPDSLNETVELIILEDGSPPSAFVFFVIYLPGKRCRLLAGYPPAPFPLRPVSGRHSGYTFHYVGTMQYSTHWTDSVHTSGRQGIRICVIITCSIISFAPCSSNLQKAGFG